MFCTGGIRCEKASAFLLKEGFAEVYQLQGGILNYLETVPPQQSLWQGECFVFDERGSVNHRLFFPAAPTHPAAPSASQTAASAVLPATAPSTALAAPLAMPSTMPTNMPAETTP